MTDLLKSFVAEGRGLIRRLVDNLLALESAPDDPEPLEEIFRAMHTLKGSSGLLDAPALTALSHAAEDLLEKARAGHVAIQPHSVDLLLEAADLLGTWLDCLESDGALPEQAMGEARALSARLGDCPESATEPGAALGGCAAFVATAGGWRSELAAMIAAGLDRLGGRLVTVLRYAPDPQSFFGGDDPLLLWKKVPELLDWRMELREPWAGSGDFDPYNCNLVFVGASTADSAELTYLFRYVSDELALATLPAEEAAALGRAGAEGAGGREDCALVAELALAIVREQVAVLAAADPDGPGFAGTVASVTGLAGGLASVVPALDRDLPELARAAVRDRETGPLRRMLAAAADDFGATLAEPDRPSAGPAPGNGMPRKTSPSRPKPGARAAGPPSSHVRVEEARLDQLMNLIGELVVAKNALPFLADRATSRYDCAPLAREIDAQYAVVDRLAQEMQNTILQLRLLPVSEVFDRFPRLVRDVSRKLGKQVRLAIDGADTEIDKAIVECLAEPMLHVVRNALDHGIEPPEERAAVGKDPTALLQISARNEADQIVIEVSDDGRGIDPDRVRTKALERGLVEKGDLEAMDHGQTLELIFRSGVSTSETVSDISGRGVGMDAVLTDIRRAGGRVQVASERGRGTRIVMSLPLSMAISRIVIVRVGDALYGIPMDMIFEMCRVARSDIRIMRGREVAVLRGQVVPLVRLRGLFDGPDADRDGTEPEHEVVVVTSTGNEMFGFVVDDLHERMETIVKPMEGVIAGLPGFVGTALLGDGSVLLVMNPEELARADAA